MGRRTKHIPQRTCVGCRQTLEKRSLIRIVRTPNGIKIDPTGKLPGRGAYLHNLIECWEKGLKGSLANALKTELSTEDKEYLNSYINNLQANNSPPNHQE